MLYILDMYSVHVIKYVHSLRITVHVHVTKYVRDGSVKFDKYAHLGLDMGPPLKKYHNFNLCS